jgi:hypothetical protein
MLKLQHTTVQQFRDHKAETVGELIELLKKFPEDIPLCSLGPDVGGYDVTEAPYVGVGLAYNSNGDEVLLVTNFEYDSYEQVQKGNLTFEEHKEFSLW